MDGGSQSPEVARAQVLALGPVSSSLLAALMRFVGELNEVTVCLLDLLPPAADPKARIQVQVLYLGSDLKRNIHRGVGK